jgi:hypothetical protein
MSRAIIQEHRCLLQAIQSIHGAFALFSSIVQLMLLHIAGIIEIAVSI